ncbi:MAG TPA: hypothetical protein VJA46_00370 [Acidimicrobiia bacterium]|nr:hypothetical protein [Acidimicrobiia bacterium]
MTEPTPPIVPEGVGRKPKFGRIVLVALTVVVMIETWGYCIDRSMSS